MRTSIFHIEMDIISPFMWTTVCNSKTYTKIQNISNVLSIHPFSHSIEYMDISLVCAWNIHSIGFFVFHFYVSKQSQAEKSSIKTIGDLNWEYRSLTKICSQTAWFPMRLLRHFVCVILMIFFHSFHSFKLLNSFLYLIWYFSFS